MARTKINQAIEILDARTSACEHLRCEEAWKTVRAKLVVVKKPVKQQRKVNILSEEKFIESVKKRLPAQAWRTGSNEFLVAIAYRQFLLMLKTSTVA